jgi:tetratricopeptide (TPR) repeat protein
MKEKNFPQPRVSPQQKTALVFLGLFLSLVLLETGMRLGGFVLLSVQEYGNLQSIKQKGAYRILCLGESTTQGQYPRLLEQILNQRNIGVPFSVIDKGRDGVKTFVLLSQVESYLDEYHPDMVVAMMGINDGGRHIPLEAPTTSGGKLFIRSFRVYKLMRLLWLHLLTKAKEIELCKPAFAQPISTKAETPHPKTERKETSAEAIFTEDNPKNDDNHVGLWRLYLDQGKLSQAEASLRRAIEINPKNFIPYFGFGWFYLEQGKLPQAEASFRKAIELNPKCDDAYVGLGELFLDLGKLSQAESLFKKAIEINPRDVMAFSDLGRLYRDHGKLSQAEDSYRRAFELDPKNERVLRAMTSLYEEMGKPELAKEYVQKVAELRLGCYSAVTINNYRKLKEILDRKGIKLVCAQYPMRDVEQLKRIFGEGEGVIFVDNERVFKEAVKQSSYKEYFRDMFGGDFGHCTQKGNELLAQNIADVILREVFKK